MGHFLDGSWWRHQIETFSALLVICAGIQSPVNSPHKGQWRGALIFSLICVWVNDWVNNREAGDLRCYRAHYDVTVMWPGMTTTPVPGVYTRIPRELPHSINPAFQGLYSSNNTLSYQKISHSLGATRLSVTMMTSLWSSTGAMTEMLLEYLSNYIAIRQLWTHTSRLRYFASTSCRLVGPMILTSHFNSYHIFYG